MSTQNTAQQAAQVHPSDKGHLFDQNIHDSAIIPDQHEKDYQMPKEILTQNIISVSEFTHTKNGALVSFFMQIKSLNCKNSKPRASSDVTYDVWVRITEARPDRIKLESSVSCNSQPFKEFYMTFDQSIDSYSMFSKYIKKVYDEHAAKKLKLPVIINDYLTNPIWVEGIVWGDDQMFLKATGGPLWGDVVKIIQIKDLLVSEEEMIELESATELMYGKNKNGTDMYRLAKGDARKIKSTRLPPSLFDITNKVIEVKNKKKKSKKHPSTIASITMKKGYYIHLYTPQFHNDDNVNNRANHGFHCNESKPKFMTSNQQQALQNKYSTANIPDKTKNKKKKKNSDNSQYNYYNNNRDNNNNNNTNTHPSPGTHSPPPPHRHHPYGAPHPHHKQIQNSSAPHRHPSQHYRPHSSQHYRPHDPYYDHYYDPYSYHQHHYGYNQHQYYQPNPQNNNKAMNSLIQEQRKQNELLSKYLIGTNNDNNIDKDDYDKLTSNSTKTKGKKSGPMYTMRRVYVLSKSMTIARKRCIKKMEKKDKKKRNKEYYNEYAISQNKFNLNWSGKSNLKVKTKHQINYFHAKKIKIGMDELHMKCGDWFSNYKGSTRRTPAMSIKTLSDITNEGLSSLDEWDTADKYPSDLMDIFVTSIDDDSTDDDDSTNDDDSTDDDSSDDESNDDDDNVSKSDDNLNESDDSSSDNDESTDIKMTTKKKK
eukprot:382166_1